MLTLFGRGEFGPDAARLSAQALAAYAFGLPAFVVVKVLVPAFFAHGDTSTPVRIGFIAIALNLALNVAFMVPLRHMGPALATSLSALFNVIALGVMLGRRGQLVIDQRLRRRLARMAAAALAMAAVLVFAQGVLFTPQAMPHWLRWAALAALVGGGLLTYALAGQLVGAFDLKELLAVVRRRRRLA